jgi:hypothetical protein
MNESMGTKTLLGMRMLLREKPVAMEIWLRLALRSAAQQAGQPPDGQQWLAARTRPR